MKTIKDKEKKITFVLFAQMITRQDKKQRWKTKMETTVYRKKSKVIEN